MKERDREILKKSKVKWEEGTVECAWERERENVCEWGRQWRLTVLKKIISNIVFIIRAKTRRVMIKY